ncbi:MAG: response regulator [Bacteroidota bacterium]
MTEASARSSGRATPTSAFLPRRVLVIDDCPDQRTIVRLMLERAGVHVDEADSGQAGLQVYASACRDNAPHEVVLMDLRMPHMDGLETTRQLLEQAATPPRIVGVTAEPHAAYFEACRSAGMEAVVTKPYRTSSLLVACLRGPRAEA